VTAQLLGGDGGTHVWAETYDRTLDPANLFAVQDEITEAVASRIGDPYGAINRAEYSRSERRAPKFQSSYDCILRFFEWGRLLTKEAHKAAIDCLEGVVKVEPNYGEALAFLGDLYADDVGFGFGNSSNSSIATALELTQRGVALDQESGSALVRYAHALFLKGDLERAVRETEKALELAPDNVDVVSIASAVFAHTGQYERAVDMMGIVRRLNPSFPPWMNWHMANVHMSRGEYNDAIEAVERSETEWLVWTPVFIAAARCALGETDQGQKSLDAALAIDPSLESTYWAEMHYWNKGIAVRPMIENVSAGLEACGWDVPPDPGPEAFANSQ
jgi:tetratricopeptide (TPR) repeat protein